RCEGDDLHEVAVAELAGNRSEDAGSTRVALRVDQHGRVLVERDVGPVGPSELLLGADDDRLDDLALANAAVGGRLLDRRSDHVAHARVTAVVAALDADDQDLARTRVVGDAQLCLLLDHRLPRALHHVEQPPALAARQRPRLDHANHVALLGAVRLVMGMQLAGPAHDLLVGRVAADDRDLDRDRLVRGSGDDGPLAHVLQAGLAVGLGRALPGLRALARAVLGGALRLRRPGRTRALALTQFLGREDLLGLRFLGGRLSRSL